MLLGAKVAPGQDEAEQSFAVQPSHRGVSPALVSILRAMLDPVCVVCGVCVNGVHVVCVYGVHVVKRVIMKV